MTEKVKSRYCPNNYVIYKIMCRHDDLKDLVNIVFWNVYVLYQHKILHEYIKNCCFFKRVVSVYTMCVNGYIGRMGKVSTSWEEHDVLYHRIQHWLPRPPVCNVSLASHTARETRDICFHKQRPVSLWVYSQPIVHCRLKQNIQSHCLCPCHCCVDFCTIHN